MHNFIIRLMACFIPNPVARRRFKKQRLRASKTDKKLDAINQKIDWVTNFVKQTTDITNLPTAHGNLRLLQMGSAKLLNVIHEICLQNGLQYWLMYGTLIGAIRHRGFIPWDDDIDIAMMRTDYDKLIEILGNGKFQNTNGQLTFNVADICKVFFKDSPARVDIFPFDQYYKCAVSDNDMAELRNSLISAHNMIEWDLVNIESFWPDIIPTCPKSYQQRMDILNEIVMKNRPAVKNGTIFRGADVININSTIRTILTPDMIFPLKTAIFDGYTVFIPNMANEILFNTYGNIYDWPNDMFPHHALLERTRPEQMNKIYELLDCDTDIIVKKISKCKK